MFKVGDVVQFNENHKWCGCLGIINEAKELKPFSDREVRYMVGVPAPYEGTAYIFVMESKNEIEYVGPAILVPETEEETDE